MKTEKIYSWVLRISNSLNFTKCFRNLLDKKFPAWISCTEARANFQLYY